MRAQKGEKRDREQGSRDVNRERMTGPKVQLINRDMREGNRTCVIWIEIGGVEKMKDEEMKTRRSGANGRTDLRK